MSPVGVRIYWINKSKLCYLTHHQRITFDLASPICARLMTDIDLSHLPRNYYSFCPISVNAFLLGIEIKQYIFSELSGVRLK